MTPLRPILIVDDNPADVELTLHALQRCQLANPVEVARDGEELLAWIPRWEAGEPAPAAILLDINMPKVSGLDALLKLKGHPQLRIVPVVMLTTSSRPEDIHKAYEYGANSFIVKPMEFEKFFGIAAQIKTYWATLNVLPE